MISLDQAVDYTKQRFHEENVQDRISDTGFAFYINTQSREYLDTKDNSKMRLGNGPIIILKETGDVYSFSSSPIYSSGRSNLGFGVNTAKSADEFNAALNDLKVNDISSTNPIDHIG